jgi:glyoxylase-like metal-dependent hydrolase (beta-lactamase superfamily II)
MPFGPPFLCVYLIRLVDGWMLVDTGMGAQALTVLEAALEEVGVPARALSMVLCTHMHPDHTAHGPAFQQRYGVPVLLHRDDAVLLAEVKGPDRYHDHLAGELLAGQTDEPTTRTTMESYRRLRATLPDLTPDRLLEGGETFPTALGPLLVLHTPGHSPGHVCLYLPDARVLVTGDHVIDDITPHIGYLPEEDALGDYLASLDVLDRLDAGLLLAGHGQPFDGLRGWTQRTRRHHEARNARILTALDDGPLGAAQLVARLWPRELRPVEFQLAFTELLSHLIYLERREQLGRRYDSANHSAPAVVSWIRRR